MNGRCCVLEGSVSSEFKPHCVKSVRIWSFSGPEFFQLEIEFYWEKCLYTHIGHVDEVEANKKWKKKSNLFQTICFSIEYDISNPPFNHLGHCLEVSSWYMWKQTLIYTYLNIFYLVWTKKEWYLRISIKTVNQSFKSFHFQRLMVCENLEIVFHFYFRFILFQSYSNRLFFIFSFLILFFDLEKQRSPGKAW